MLFMSGIENLSKTALLSSCHRLLRRCPTGFPPPFRALGMADFLHQRLMSLVINT